jgi:hypothetical protein
MESLFPILPMAGLETKSLPLSDPCDLCERCFDLGVCGENPFKDKGRMGKAFFLWKQ